MRYGEGRRQKAAFSDVYARCGVSTAKQLQGKELSRQPFIADTDAAVGGVFVDLKRCCPIGPEDSF